MKTKQELEEIISLGEMSVEQFNTRLSISSIKKFHYIQGILQLSNIGRLSKSSTLEYIINEQFAIMCEQPKARTYADQIAREHREGKRL